MQDAQRPRPASIEDAIGDGADEACNVILAATQVGEYRRAMAKRVAERFGFEVRDEVELSPMDVADLWGIELTNTDHAD